MVIPLGNEVYTMQQKMRAFISDVFQKASYIL